MMRMTLKGQYREVRHVLCRRATVSLAFVPIFMGSAYKNKGVQLLLDGVSDYLPSPCQVRNTALVRIRCLRRQMGVTLAFWLHAVTAEDLEENGMSQAISRQVCYWLSCSVGLSSANAILQDCLSPQDAGNQEEPVSLACNRDGPLVALAFKLEEGRYGQLTYMRIYSGTLRKGDNVVNVVNGKRVKVSYRVPYFQHCCSPASCEAVLRDKAGGQRLSA